MNVYKSAYAFHAEFMSTFAVSLLSLEAKVAAAQWQPTQVYRKAAAGETESDHEELLEFCRSFQFERCGAFAYSEEDGTPAAHMSNQAQPQLVCVVATVQCVLQCLM